MYIKIADWNILIQGVEDFCIDDLNNYSLFVGDSLVCSEAKLTFLPPLCEFPKKHIQQSFLDNCCLQGSSENYNILDEIEFNSYISNRFSAYAFSQTKKEMRVFMYKLNKPYLNLSVPLMFLLGNFAALQDGLMLHGASGVINGKAFAILGIPEAGKSTSIEMIEHDFLLSDDLLIMRLENNKPILHSTPLGPNTSGVMSASLTTIFFPIKSNAFKLVKLSRLQSIERFYSSQSGYWNKVFKPYRKMYFDRVLKLFDTVQAYDMFFSKDYIDNEAIKACM